MTKQITPTAVPGVRLAPGEPDEWTLIRELTLVLGVFSITMGVTAVMGNVVAGAAAGSAFLVMFLTLKKRPPPRVTMPELLGSRKKRHDPVLPSVLDKKAYDGGPNDSL